MARYSQQDIRIELERNFEEALSIDQLKRNSDSIGVAALDLVQKRIRAGLDNKGNKFKSYTDKYKEFKRRFIRRDVRKNKNLRRLLRKANQYPARARSVNHYMRLTGELFAAMDYEVSVRKQSVVNIKLKIKGRRNKKKAEGLYKNGYEFFGLAKSGRTKQNEQRQLRNIIFDALGAEIKGAKIRLR